jgi:hypothetical protein
VTGDGKTKVAGGIEVAGDVLAGEDVVTSVVIVTELVEFTGSVCVFSVVTAVVADGLLQAAVISNNSAVTDNLKTDSRLFFIIFHRDYPV